MLLGSTTVNTRLVFKWDALGKEILGMALPAALAVAADPIASLIDTAFIGHIGIVLYSLISLALNKLSFLGVSVSLCFVLCTGPVELAAAGVSIALFNQASRITIFPLVSITTSFVAEEDTFANMKLKAAQVENLEDENLDNLEKGAAKQELEELDKNSLDKTCEMEGLKGDDKLGNAKAGKATSSGESLTRKSESNSEEEKDTSEDSNSKDSEPEDNGTLSLLTSLSSLPSK